MMDFLMDEIDQDCILFSLRLATSWFAAFSKLLANLLLLFTVTLLCFHSCSWPGTEGVQRGNRKYCVCSSASYGMSL